MLFCYKRPHMNTNKYLINRKEPKRLLIFKSSNRILKSKHLKKKQTYQRKMSKSLSGKFSKNYFHISPLFTRGKHHIIFSTTCGYFHVFWNAKFSSICYSLQCIATKGGKRVKLTVPVQKSFLHLKQGVKLFNLTRNNRHNIVRGMCLL